MTPKEVAYRFPWAHIGVAGLLIGFGIAWGTARADLSSKVDRSDFLVLKTEVQAMTSTMHELRNEMRLLRDELRAQRRAP